MYENVVFDLYGTLIDIHTDETKDSVWETMSWYFRLHQVNITPKKLKKAYFRQIEQLENEKRKILGQNSYPEIDLIFVFQKLFEQHGVVCDEMLAKQICIFFRACTLERLRLYKGIEDLLKSLKEAGKNIYLLTNAQKVFTESEIEYAGFTEYFDGIVYSSEEGIRKPDRQFYQILIDRYQLRPEKTVMIGNDPECDVCGALNAGISAIYLKSNIRGNGNCPETVKMFKVSNLDELKTELLKRG